MAEIGGVPSKGRITEAESIKEDYGEPSAYEYGKAINIANKNASTNGFECVSNNVGFDGWWVTTPNGNKYVVKKSSSWGDKKYSICEYLKGYDLNCGAVLPNCWCKFKGLDDAKQYMLDNDM